MQAAQRSAWHEVRAAISRSVTMSASASLPPGRSTRAASANTRRLSAERLTTPLEITASNEPSSKGSSSMRAARKLTCSSRRRRSDLASCSGVMSTPVTEPPGPTCAAAANTSMPEPLPRSSTRSPGEQAREAEVVAHARERVHGLGGQPVEQLGWVAELLGERAAGGEVEIAARASFATSRYISAMWRSSSSGSTPPAVGICGGGVHAGSVAGAPSQNLPGRGGSSAASVESELMRARRSPRGGRGAPSAAGTTPSGPSAAAARAAGAAGPAPRRGARRCRG